MSLAIGIDLDNVIYDFTKKFQECAAREGYDVGEPSHWYYYRDCGITDDLFKKIMDDSVDDLQLFWRGDVLGESTHYINLLRDAGHTIHLVTNRFSGNIYTSPQATRYWLESRGVMWDSLTFTEDKTSVKTDVFIEDCLENYDALASVGTDVYLVNYPYNMSEGDDRRRVDSFDEFAQLILKLGTGTGDIDV